MTPLIYVARALFSFRYEVSSARVKLRLAETNKRIHDKTGTQLLEA